MAEKKDHYIRLVTFVGEVCPPPLVELFQKKAKADTQTGIQYSTLDAYLQFQKNTILSMPNINAPELQNILSKPGDLRKWDITLLIKMLNHIFRPIPQKEEQFLNDILIVRNELSHKAGELELNDTEFKDEWKTLETAITGLAECVDKTCEKRTRGYIAELKTKSIPPSGPALDILKQWHNADKELHKDTKLAVAAAKGSKNILKDVVVCTTKTSGAVLKRIKTNDHILDGMKAQFTSTMDRCNKTDYNTPNEMEDILIRFRRHHRVLITGNGNLEAALTAINDQNITHDRCVIINSPDDIRHVCCDYVDLVLCVNPFGRDIYDERKASEMTSQFDRLLDYTKLSEDAGRIEVIMISDATTFQEYCRVHEHDLLDQVVALNKPTTEDTPIKIQDTPSTHTSERTESVLYNLIGHSKVYIEQLQGHTVNEKVSRKAKHVFKQHKSILITGSKSSRKDILAASLTSKYRPDQCLVLTDPADWKFVKLGDISVVLVEDFAGKYKYDNALCVKWLKVFDLIYASVKGGKLNVIITSNQKYLDRCTSELGTQPLLERSVELTDDDIGMKIIKTEVDQTVASGSNQGNGTMIGATFNESLVKYVGRYQLPRGDSNDTRKEVHSMCTVSDGTLLKISAGKLYHFDSSYKVIDILEGYRLLPTVVCLNKHQAAVRTYNTIMIVSFHGSTVLPAKKDEEDEEEKEEEKMLVVKSFHIDSMFNTSDMCYQDGELFMYLDEFNIVVYSVTGTKVRTIDLRQSFIDNNMDFNYFGSIAMNENSIAMYVVVNGENKIVCLNMDWDIIWSSPVSSDDDTDICIDSDNKVYYISSDDEIRQISASGQNDEVLVKYSDKSISDDRESKLCVDSQRRVLYVSHKGDTLDKFQLC